MQGSGCKGGIAVAVCKGYWGVFRCQQYLLWRYFCRNRYGKGRLVGDEFILGHVYCVYKNAVFLPEHSQLHMFRGGGGEGIGRAEQGHQVCEDFPVFINIHCFQIHGRPNYRAFANFLFDNQRLIGGNTGGIGVDGGKAEVLGAGIGQGQGCKHLRALRGSNQGGSAVEWQGILGVKV